MGANILMLSICAKFKILLWKILRETRVFVDNTQKKFYNTNQYQLENVIDWLAYIKYLQSVLNGFDVVNAFTNNF